MPKYMSQFTILANDYLEWLRALSPTEKEKRDPYDLSNIQLYNPLYSRVFPGSVTADNYNSITWPNHLQICGENAVCNPKTGEYHQRPTFIKFSPLLDPMRYLIGKYDYTDTKLRILPNLDNLEDVHSKIAHHNNVSYIDAFMCYLSSQLADKYGFCHGLDYYGSYLAIQKHFKYNATDDIDYLSTSSFFVEHLGHEYSMDMDEETQLKCGSRGCKHKIHILDGEETEQHAPLNITLGTLDDTDVMMMMSDDDSSNRSLVSLQSFCSVNAETTSQSDADEEPRLEIETDMLECDSILNYTDTSNPDVDDPISLDDLDSVSEDADADDDDDDEHTEYTSVTESEVYDEDEEQVYVYIKDFPTQMICLGKCDGTLDELMCRGEMDGKYASAWLFQIIMSLLVYQKAFQFTHNDLHTNNIMYVTTDVKHIDYVYEGVKYRVPTYGKIFKIIDFGRAIYRYNGMVFCSDSYAQGGDAYTQYNCEPFFNTNAKRVDPNFSFDLCRLACSMYLYILEHDTPETDMDEYQRTIYRWCLDDNGKNVLFKKNGEERYPDFKLYKMIARHVHKHTPENQLSYPFFNQYAITSAQPKQWMVLGVDVDAVPRLSSGGDSRRYT